MNETTMKRITSLVMLVTMCLGIGLVSGFALDRAFHLTSQITEYRVEHAHAVALAKCSARTMIFNPDAELDTCQVRDDRK